MRALDQKGVTLVELIISISILAIIAGATFPLLSTSLDAHNQGMSHFQLYHQGMLAMERMTHGVGQCTYLLVPNAHTPIRTSLIYSGTINDDNDFYFNDPLFPRIDEDPWRDMNDDDKSGLAGFDDDGDGFTDEWLFWLFDYDDDEDGLADEDGLDGKDNDGDGNIDEDMGADANMDLASGVKGMDDDGDGQVDEEDEKDDDEDGVQDEDPLNETLYWVDGTTDTLYQKFPLTGEIKELANHVTFFQITYEAPERILMELTLTGDTGQSVEFVEYVYPRNTFQKTGKWVK